MEYKTVEELLELGYNPAEIELPNDRGTEISRHVFYRYADNSDLIGSIVTFVPSKRETLQITYDAKRLDSFEAIARLYGRLVRFNKIPAKGKRFIYELLDWQVDNLSY